jgi:hypothetical protein
MLLFLVFKSARKHLWGQQSLSEPGTRELIILAWQLLKRSDEKNPSLGTQ